MSAKGSHAAVCKLPVQRLLCGETGQISVALTLSWPLGCHFAPTGSDPYDTILDGPFFANPSVSGWQYLQRRKPEVQIKRSVTAWRRCARCRQQPKQAQGRSEASTSAQDVSGGRLLRQALQLDGRANRGPELFSSSLGIWIPHQSLNASKAKMPPRPFPSMSDKHEARRHRSPCWPRIHSQ